MATSGETFGRNFASTGLEGDNFSSEQLFHLQASRPGSSVFPFYDESLHMHGETVDSAECMNAGKKMGPISRTGYMTRKETGQSPDLMRCVFQNTRDGSGSVLDHLNDRHTLPLQQSDGIASFMSSQQSSYDDMLSDRFKYNSSRNFENCDQLPRSVPSNEDVRFSTDSFMVSNQFRSTHQGSCPGVANKQKGSVSVNDVNWSSFAVIDPLNRLTGCRRGVRAEREHHSKMAAIPSTSDTTVEDMFRSTATLSTIDSKTIELPGELNCKTSSVLHGRVQTVPSTRADNGCASKAAPPRSSIDCYEQASCGLNDCISEKDDTNNVPEATSAEARCHADSVSASNFEICHKSPSSDVNEGHSKDSGRESSCRSASKRTEANKKQEPFFDPRRIFATPVKQLPQKACSKSAKPAAKTAECTQTSGNEKNSESCKVRKDSTESKTSSSEQNNSSVLNNKSPSQCHSGQTLDHGHFIRNDLSDGWKHKSTHAVVDEQRETSDSSKIHETVRRDVVGDRTSCRKVKNEFTQNVNVQEDHTVVSESRKISSYLANINREKIYSFLAWTSYEMSLLVVNIMKLLVGVILHEIFSIFYYICWIAWQGIRWIHVKLREVLWTDCSNTNENEGRQWNRTSHANHPHQNRFLSENINLPESGDEAIRRLFSCEGKDPYSILGLKVDCTDEEIRKYYRRQAVLVHPDKVC